jgi:4-hydroxythreonine-4-phosphate dehydrogenase
MPCVIATTYHVSMERPTLLITMGDVAGIGPEVLAKGWPALQALCRPIVIGDAGWLERTVEGLQIPVEVFQVQDLSQAAPSASVIPVVCGSDQDLSDCVPGRISAQAGRAAYDFLCKAIDLTRSGLAAGIVTLPLHKEGLRASGLSYPGHTEILAERTGTKEYGMMLYARGPTISHGLGVVHVTLHMALRDVFRHLSTAAVLAKIRLLGNIMRQLCQGEPRLAVAALNPHASDGGLFGEEERTVIGPAVRQAAEAGIPVTGPWPSDTLFVRAAQGDFDGIVAMYHDQGHIPLKLLSGLAAVNITLGLPLVRTSVAHGTAYDIAGQGKADHRSLVEAVRVAAKLVRGSLAFSRS